MVVILPLVSSSSMTPPSVTGRRIAVGTTVAPTRTMTTLMGEVIVGFNANTNLYSQSIEALAEIMFQ